MHATRRVVGFVLAGFVLALAACGGGSSGPRPPLPPMEPPPGVVPAAPAAEATTLAELVPEGAAAPAGVTSGVDGEGRFRCVQAYAVRPEADAAGCTADGYEVRARVAFTFEPGAAEATAAPAEAIGLSEIRRCGRTNRPVARPRARTLRQVAPGLADAERAAAVEGLATGPCRDERLAFAVEPGVEHELDGTVHRFRAAGGSGTVRLTLGETVVGEWTVGASAITDKCDPYSEVEVEWQAAVEVLCAGDVAVVGGGLWRTHENPPCVEGSVTPGEARPGVPCDPAHASDPGYILESYVRQRVHLTEGSAEPLAVTPPELHPTAGS